MAELVGVGHVQIQKLDNIELLLGEIKDLLQRREPSLLAERMDAFDTSLGLLSEELGSLTEELGSLTDDLKVFSGRLRALEEKAGL